MIIKKIKGYHFTVLTGWVLRVLTAIAQLYLVKILYSFLGQEEYAKFAVLVGIAPWFLLGDFGVGSALQNLISRKIAANESYSFELKENLKKSLFSSSLVAFLLLIFFAILKDTSSLLLKFSNNQIGITIFILFVSFTPLLSVIGKVYFAEKKGYKTYFINFIASSVVVGALWLIQNYTFTQPFNIALICFLLPGFLIGIGITCKRILFDSVEPSQKVRPLNGSMNFFYFGLISNLVLQIDYFFLGALGTSEDILQYNVLSKMFSFAYFFYQAIIQSLWPVFTEDFFLKKSRSIKKNIEKSFILGAVMIVVFTVLFYLYQGLLIEKLLGIHDLNVSPVLFILFGVYYILRAWTDVFACFLQSIEKTRWLIKLIPIQAVIACVGQYALIKNMGASGVVLSLIISFLATVVWFLPIKTMTIIKDIK